MAELKTLEKRHAELKGQIGELANADPLTASDADNLRDLMVEAKNLELQIDAMNYGQPAPADNGDNGSGAKDAGEPPANGNGQKGMNEKIDMIFDALQKSGPLKDAGYFAPDDEDGRANTKSLGDFLLAVQRGNVKRLNSVYKAALAEDSGATGGYLVPAEFEPRLLEIVEEEALVRPGATVVPMGSRTLQYPILNYGTTPSSSTAFLGGAKVYWTEEAGTLTETEPTFEMIELVAHKVAAYSQASNEVAADAAASVEGILTNILARAVAWEEDYQFINGNGVGKPLGIRNADNVLIDVDPDTSNVFDFADAVEMRSRLLPQSMGRAVWFMHPAMMTDLYAMEIGTSGANAWAQSLAAGQQEQLLGMPIYWTEKLPEDDNPDCVMLVDRMMYLVGDRAGTQVAFSEHAAFTTDEGTWRVVRRVDGQPWVENSITLASGTHTVSPFVSFLDD